ncbi:MAG: oligosaccharide flippase family protein [Thermofilaceae archaeon]|nr:oligosaccharide flippase family protein [Thermofilaceae archaeon]
MGDRDALTVAAAESVASAFSLFGGQVLATFIAGLSSIVLARLLGPEGYGRYSLSTTVASFLMLLTNFGVHAALTREASKLVAKGSLQAFSPLVGVALRFSLITSFLASTVGFLFSSALSLLLLNRLELVHLVRLALPLVIIDPLFNLVYASLLGLGDAKALALMPIVRDFSRGVLSPLLALGSGCEGAVTGLVVGHALAAVAGFILLWRRVGGLGFARWGDLKPLLRYGLPLHVSTVLSTGLMVYQNSLLAWFATDEEVGNLKIAGNFYALLQLVSLPITSALFPAFSKLEKEESGRAFKFAVKYSALLLAPAGAYACVMSRDLVRLIYGDAYRLAPVYFSIQAVSFLWSGLGTAVLGSFLQGIGESKVVFEAMLVYASAFVPLSLSLALVAGVYGVLVATLASNLAFTLFSLREALKRGVSLDWSLALRVCLASILAVAMAGALSLISSRYVVRLAFSMAGFLFAYGLLAPSTGCLNLDDLKQLEFLLGKTPIGSIVKPILSIEKAVVGMLSRYGGKA